MYCDKVTGSSIMVMNYGRVCEMFVMMRRETPGVKRRGKPRIRTYFPSARDPLGSPPTSVYKPPPLGAERSHSCIMQDLMHKGSAITVYLPSSRASEALTEDPGVLRNVEGACRAITMLIVKFEEAAGLRHRNFPSASGV
jgi:hypothetical protein